MSSGIQWSTAVGLAGEGGTVVASARREDRLQELIEEIRRKGGEATAVRSDISDREEVLELARRVHEAHGRCDILVNNAGVPGGGAFASLSREQVERVVLVNDVGVLSHAVVAFAGRE